MSEARTVQSRQTSAPAPGGHERVTRSPVFHLPRVDVYESPDAFVVYADLPGVPESDVDVTVEKNVLTITAKAEPRAPEGYERLWGPEPPREYRRVFRLGDAVDSAQIQASMRDGTLRLTLPKAHQARARRIPVSAAA